MQAAVIVFPGSNCDRDMWVALKQSMGKDPIYVWHKDSQLPDVDLVVLPGGFSYGDYLRSGAMAARSPIMQEVIQAAARGVYVLGVCNGFQILTEAGLLPGTLVRNRDLKFICRDVCLKVNSVKSYFTGGYGVDQVIRLPVAHHDGCYIADPDQIKFLQDRGLVAFQYCDAKGEVIEAANVNGSMNNIAGILNKQKNVLGMMPHPERYIEQCLGGVDGRNVFDSLVNCIS
jgi:phosphoribosylformylglycinamidine synthase I